MLASPQLQVDALSTFSLAAQQNAYPILKTLSLYYPSSNLELGESAPPQNNVKVVLNAIPDWLEEELWVVDEICPGQTISLPLNELKFPFSKLFGLTEEIALDLNFSVYVDDEIVCSQSLPLSVLPANYWGGESRQPDLLAAFIKPNGLFVESLIKQVADVLEKSGHGRSVDGYQSNTREKPYVMLAALWNVLFQQKLAYVSPPQGFAHTGQRIRLANDISSAGICACLDSSLLFASCIEAMGLNPVVALTKEHAFAGAWLIDDRLPIMTNDDPMDIRKRVDNRDIVLFETTLVTNAKPVTFKQSQEYARELISEENEHNFVMVLDIAQARARQIKPLSTVEEKREEQGANATADIELELPEAPPLPPVRADERVQEETPDTRIDTWSRKLLDLTKRNSLLNFSERAVSVKLYCPDIAAMEDMLADGNKFRFLSAEESPLNDRERDKDNFRMRTGSDLHRQFALDQLQQNTLVANQSAKRLDKNAVSLFRKAKNDLEEGGSNTLYLALGMLKWKENPDDQRSFRAPLILIPVSLSRRSARAPVYLEQLQDEDPIFNLTLIEFLYTEHDINLMEFRDELPEDDSGVDVPLVWHRVREAISEHRGFEVVEELVLASFSFAKYLMWKDLRDRIDDLKENPFVRHLVDSPRDPYTQTAQFIEPSDADDKIDPAEVFTPLNCDSSQLIAVEASGHPQDFVLEGPPGTGKSETIANIIAHNLGKGRKVLFVAEKMAALNVVYRRMQKVGLDHLCLELHSNKTNKKAVLEQLGKAWQKREGLNTRTWEMNLAELKTKKDQLNGYVRALHKKSASGVSARDAISTLSRHDSGEAITLSWPMDLAATPFKTPGDLAQAEKLLENLSLAFADVQELDGAAFEPVKATSWSNVWQNNLLSNLSSLAQQLPNLDSSISTIFEQISLKQESNCLADIKAIVSLCKLAELAQSNHVDFALSKGAKERLETIELLESHKSSLDSLLDEFGYAATPEKLVNAPIEYWVQLAEESTQGWFKAFINKMKLNSQAKKLGFTKIVDVTKISLLPKAKQLIDNIEGCAATLEKFDIWQGWTTSPSHLKEQLSLGLEVRQHLSELLALCEEPLDLMLALNKWLVEGRDYLDESKLISNLGKFRKLEQDFSATADSLSKFEFSLDQSASLAAIKDSADNVISAQRKLKNWCEWQQAKKQIANENLGDITSALEAGIIGPTQVVDQFYLAYSKWIAPLLIDADPVLREFKASTHEQTIKRFRELDAQVAAITADYIVALASNVVPDPNTTSKKSEFGTLARELQKKTRHIPTRALINQLGSSLLDLCPCLMMSPLSVAQFLPTDFQGFDLVVFDEASQMTTWDSVGAIARGKNTIVVGDPKQMPPTNFFAAASSGDDPDEEDLESILDQALAARLPLKRLMGHYRSKHETLIAFSNSKYYENSLVTYPSSETKESVVTLHRVNGVYAKGKGRNNPIEAKAVVDEVIKRLLSKNEQGKTLGIVTLNTDQQRTIEDLLDDARRTNPEIEKFFHQEDGRDPVFVKNLESVQGDERDVIILSLGYGPTEPDGKTMSMNFGPLNKNGGERRLNVAITRATTEVLVFSSFDSSMIDLSRTSATAVEHLKHYLEFAERGPSALAEQSFAAHGVDQFDSDFEQAVAFWLREKGWKVQTQVGVSKFRVDLGIIHPDRPGVYLAGVECDGATYHSSPSARDRDRVRQVILENLGWNILRLWSTDYFVDPDFALEKIDAQLNSLLEESRQNPEPEIEKTDDVPPVAEAADVSLLDEDAQDTSEAPAKSPTEISAGDYFKDDNKPNIVQFAKELLAERPAITLHALALEVANLHGLSRTSKKQIDHLRSLIEPWAGIVENQEGSPTVWVTPDEIVSEINWRGVNAFGYPRKWSEIAPPEIKGLVKYALNKSPGDPVGVICDEFDLKRRRESTLSVFNDWVMSELSERKDESTSVVEE
ncbi:DNA helicase [Neiella marina]|uniref:DNA helicase n=1 Tax=Neiella marina TaxID=508461 RepID=A0A8J2U546_9GAMM|nr:DUF4011 domain-containing protein [Neiella marina]GGA77197.1 DNA helicase [Neiella marina]